jgi:4-hydroxythreonine-4-phosphate dehydrogenase
MMKPTILLTMGDASGVGPEIIAKALSAPDPTVTKNAGIVVVGDAGRLRQAAELVSSSLQVNPVRTPAEAVHRPGVVDIIDVPGLPEDLPWGELSAEAGRGAYLYVEKAVDLALSGQADAICTAPLNKAALRMAGYPYPGHTEMLAALSGIPEVSMMLATHDLRVIHVTTHLGLIDAIERIDPELEYRTIRRGHDLLVASGLEHPRIAVCAVNPHAGEHGLFGRGEEEGKIRPGVEKARAEGVDAHGPLPADTLFYMARRGDYDLVVAQYHDQGHIPIKLLGLKNGVNVTVGLPFVRTSVDHGTAFDIAGTGTVDHEPLLEALRQAVRLAPRQTDEVRRGSQG